MPCAQSFSKIIDLYGERIGNLTLMYRDPSTIASLMGQLAPIAYFMYAFPPKHGALIVQATWNDADLHAEWLENLKAMSTRIVKSIRFSLYSHYSIIFLFFCRSPILNTGSGSRTVTNKKRCNFFYTKSRNVGRYKSFMNPATLARHDHFLQRPWPSICR